MPESRLKRWSDLGLEALEDVQQVAEALYGRVYIEDPAHLASEEGRLALAAEQGKWQVVQDINAAIDKLERERKGRAE